MFHFTLPPFPHVFAWLPFSRTHSSARFPRTTTHKFPVFIPFQPPFHYACPTNYSSLIPQFSQLQHSRPQYSPFLFTYMQTIAHLPALALPKKQTKNKQTKNNNNNIHTNKYMYTHFQTVNQTTKESLLQFWSDDLFSDLIKKKQQQQQQQQQHWDPNKKL